MNLACPTCGDDWLTQIFNLAGAPPLKPGMGLPCKSCLEIAMVTPELALRKTTRAERRDIMSDPKTRERIELFAKMSQEYRLLREDVQRANGET